jgi:hypothetical protein
MEKNTIIINGKKISFTGNAVINIKKDTSDNKEKKIDTDNKSRMLIEIEGDVGDIFCESSNILINGNANKIILKEGNVKCNNVNGNVVCSSVQCENINGDLNTTGDVVCNSFNGNTNVGNVIDNFIPIKSKENLKEKMVIYHKKYGKGVIKSIWSYSGGGSISVDFDDEEYSKTLFIDKIIKNGSVSFHNNINVIKEFEKEYDSI